LTSFLPVRRLTFSVPTVAGRIDRAALLLVAEVSFTAVWPA
jgi:hypothetical protein